MKKKTRVVVRKQKFQIMLLWKNLDKIGWAYIVPLKLSTGHTSLWQTDCPYYDHRTKQETNGITISCFFCMVVFGALYDLHVRSTRKKLFPIAISGRENLTI